MKKLLIVVDYQNDFVNGSLGFEEALKLEEIILKKIDEYNDIIFTLDTHFDDYMSTKEGEKLPIPHCIKGTVGHELFGKVKEKANKALKIFEKNTFPSLDLANYLKDKDYDYVEICGLVSNICVISNAVMVKSALPNATIVVDSKATSCAFPKLNEEALDILESIHVDVLR